jgi:hypothetical protein
MKSARRSKRDVARDRRRGVEMVGHREIEAQGVSGHHRVEAILVERNRGSLVEGARVFAARVVTHDEDLPRELDVVVGRSVRRGAIDDVHTDAPATTEERSGDKVFQPGRSLARDRRRTGSEGPGGRSHGSGRCCASRASPPGTSARVSASARRKCPLHSLRAHGLIALRASSTTTAWWSDASVSTASALVTAHRPAIAGEAHT